MKKCFAIILCLVVLTAILSGCYDYFIEVSREPIDVKYTEAYDAVETDYTYRFNWWSGNNQIIPAVKTVHHDEEWSIQYLVTYAEGNQGTVWCSCTEEEYNRVKDELNLDEK